MALNHNQNHYANYVITKNYSANYIIMLIITEIMMT